MESTPSAARFGTLEIGEGATKEVPKKDGLSMKEHSRTTMKGGWPAWTCTGISRNQALERMSFTIRADPMYRTYASSGNPSELFEKAAGWLVHIKEMDLDDEKEAIIERKSWKHCAEQFSGGITLRELAWTWI